MNSGNSILKIFLSAFLFPGQLVLGQHYQFSQFYAAPTYLNPAFTGADVCSRASLNYRNQWSGVQGGFTTYQVALDHALSRYKGGIGLQVFKDQTGLGGLTTTQINALYAYEIRINKQWMGRAGISMGGAQRSVDLGRYTFGDQIARNDPNTSVEAAKGNSIRYFDAGVGALLFSRTSWWGFSAAHINEPNQSLTGDVSALPAELRLHGGYKYTFSESIISGEYRQRHSVTLAFNYKKQAKFNQIDVGLYYNKDILVLGCWYRGIPVFRPIKDYRNNDALVFLFGVSVKKFNFGYSYDLTLSKLTNSSSHGTHELSLSYQFCKTKKKQKRRLVLVSCPKF